MAENPPKPEKAPEKPTKEAPEKRLENNRRSAQNLRETQTVKKEDA